MRMVSVGDGFGEVAVKVNGAVIEVHEDGSVAAHMSGDVDVYTDASVRVHPAANDSFKTITAAPAELKPGDRMDDGTIYAGISPDTHKPMYTTLADARSKTFFGREKRTFGFAKALIYAEQLDTHGHRDWRVPTAGELHLLFNNHAAIGDFNVSGSTREGCYWSSASHFLNAWRERFSDGDRTWRTKDAPASLRCVRG